MAIIEDVTNIKVNMKLNNGTKNDKVQTISQSIGEINIDSFDSQKAMNIVNAVSPCLNKDIYEVVKTQESTLKTAE